ncbi:ABC transporter permease [Paenibacillus tuaregi]|uniref:ABC transporter permease n=1 Tax=Paenibacillus tuaregi TaxID=1816681 RepID=UPI0008396E89|nr:ABC transporter permease [Paenibacillus tuaregi]
MLKLIRLELKKNRMGGYIKGVIIANLVIIAFLSLVYYGGIEEMDRLLQTYEGLFDMAGTIVKVTFVIFASAIMSRMIIDEYKAKTIQLMFMYPISRKKILAAKLMIIFVFTVVTILLSTAFIDALIIVVDRFFNIIEEPLTSTILAQTSIKVLITSLSAGGISLIPLFFGMRKYSTPATIISSFLVVGLISSNNGGVNLSDIIAIPITLGLVGVITAFLTIRNVNTKDVI